jgi:MSHA pilin protein MshD
MCIHSARSTFRVQGSRFNSEPGTLNPERRKAAGLSLVELIVFIVVVSVAVTGVLAAINMATRGSADPMIQKQALAIAEAVLEEVQLQAFTYCDPDDPVAATALNAAACTTAEAIGPEGLDVPPTGPAETRAGAVRPFDNVNDYMVPPSGFTMTGVTDITGSTVPGLEGYTTAVTVAGQSLGPGVTPPTNIPAVESLLITVTVTGPGNTTVVLHGYRVRYAPNALP